MDNIKVGDYLLCKEDFRPSTIVSEQLEKDKLYQVKKISKVGEHEVIYFYDIIFCLWYKNDHFFSTEGEKWYIWKYFYTPAELRQKQIDSVINE